MSQLTQAKGITMGMEAERRAMPYCMGSLYWQLNDCWPVVSWSSIDFMGNWKALHYKAKKSFQDVLVSSFMKEDTLRVSLVSDKLKSKEGLITYEFLDFKGNIQANIQDSITVKANASTEIFSIGIDQVQPDHVATVLKVTLTTDDADFNTSSLHYLARPKDLQLPKEDISTKITKTEDGFSIEVSSKTLQKDVFFYTKAKGHFSDNFFDVLPNETITIIFKTEAETLDDLAFKTLNGIQQPIVK